MAAPSVRIRVGAEVDASLGRAFRTAVQMQGQAEKAMQRNKRQTTQAAEGEARKQLRAQEQLARASESLSRQRSRALFQQYQAEERAAARTAAQIERTRARAEANARREIEKTMRHAMRLAQQQARAQEQAQDRVRDRFARRTSHRTTRFLMPEAPLGSMAVRAVGDVVRGAGIDLSLGGAVSRMAAQQTQAIDLSNSGYQAGAAGPNGQRVDPNELIGQARAVGMRLGMDTSDVLEGLAQFQKITGDLATGRTMLNDMATLAKATGSSLSDMAAAAANVSNGLGDTPDKAKILDEVMRTIAGQGKLGAVEISDMATQMARVAASASAFSGDRADIIGKMGALAQVARAEGGAPSAAESARSVVGFANTMKKSARINAFKNEGIDVFTDKSKTKLKDPIELIKESLMATGGDLQAMNKLFMDVVGARSVSGLQKTFVGAGGGQAGLDAVDAQVQRMLKAQITRAQVEEDAARSANSIQSKAARFQAKLDEINQATMAKLLPTLEKLEGPMLKFAGALGSLAEAAANHPWSAVAVAVGGALAASVARAGLESLLRAAIERSIAGTPMPFAGGAGGGGAGAGPGGVILGGAGRMGGLRGAINSPVGGALAATAAMVSVGAAMDQNDALKRENGGLGILDIGWRSLTEGKNPFQVVDEEMNRQAKAEAAARGAAGVSSLLGEAMTPGGPGAAAGNGPLVDQLKAQNDALKLELAKSERTQAAMLAELRLLNAKGGGVPHMSQEGRGSQL